MSVLELPPSTDSVPAARRFVREALRGTEVDVDTALLLVSEVVTNAVLHARSNVRVVVEPGTAVARVEVHDGSPVPPRRHTFSTMSATGRGLRLLEQLALEWGVEPGTDGKTVWFEVGPPSDDAWATSLDVDGLLAEGIAGD